MSARMGGRRSPSGRSRSRSSWPLGGSSPLPMAPNWPLSLTTSGKVAASGRSWPAGSSTLPVNWVTWTCTQPRTMETFLPFGYCTTADSIRHASHAERGNRAGEQTDLPDVIEQLTRTSSAPTSRGQTEHRVLGRRSRNSSTRTKGVGAVLRPASRRVRKSPGDFPQALGITQKSHGFRFQVSGRSPGRRWTRSIIPAQNGNRMNLPYP
jgi:hypothetical protein